ncbi:MAG: hypothetical protein Q9182_001791 [Xanthomendoza sp. 2 TL-2023]
MVMDPYPHCTLLSLPTETLLQIIEHELHHKNLENFALCSKATFELSRSARAKHLEKKRKFSTFVVGDTHVYSREDDYTVPPNVHPILSLRDFLADETAIEYCRILKMGGADKDGEMTSKYGDCVHNDIAEVSAGLLLQLRSLFEKEPYRTYFKELELIESIEEFTTLAYCIPMISLCNAQVLELTNCSDFMLELAPLLQIPRLTLFRPIEVGLFGDHDERGPKIHLLSRFADLPSVRKIYGFHITGDVETGDPLHYSTKALDLEELHFERSGIDGYCFERLLNSCKALKIFYYEDDYFMHDTFDTGPRRTIFSLRMNSLATLESLTLVAPSGEEASCVNDRPYHTELCDFQVLKHVALNCSIFTSEETEDGPLRLVDTLPPSLETLELYRPKTDEFLQGMFLGLRELREKRLPKLRSISIQTGVQIDHVIRRDCEALDIQLASVDAPKKRWPHIVSS